MSARIRGVPRQDLRTQGGVSVPRKEYRISDFVWFALFALIRPEPMTDLRPRKLQADPDGVFPHLSAKRLCSTINPLIQCEARASAYKRGEFYPDFEMQDWVFSIDAVDSMREPCDKAIWQEDRGNWTGEPFRWTCCPFCGEVLPSTGLIKQLHERNAWGEDQADGN